MQPAISPITLRNTNNMAIKIQINSVEALERLIGGDTETEIEIRNSVVQQFAKRHLKAVAQEQMTVALKNTMIQEIRDKFLKHNGSSWSNDFTLNEDTAKLVEDEVKGVINAQLSDTIRQTINSYNLEGRIMRLINMHEERFQDTCIKKFSDAEIEKLVNKRIKEKLNIQ